MTTTGRHKKISKIFFAPLLLYLLDMMACQEAPRPREQEKGLLAFGPSVPKSKGNTAKKSEAKRKPKQRPTKGSTQTTILHSKRTDEPRRTDKTLEMLAWFEDNADQVAEIDLEAATSLTLWTVLDGKWVEVANPMCVKKTKPAVLNNNE